MENNIEEKKKLRPNEWLIDQDFLSKTKAKNFFYFENLCYHVAEYLKNIPIPAISTFDPKNQRLYFVVGKKFKTWQEIDPNISYLDFITIIRRWFLQFYPSYSVSFTESVNLSDKEVIDIMKEKDINLDEALEIKKDEEVKEEGMVGEITLSKDEFLFTKNNKIKTIRISGNPYNGVVLPLNKFLKEVREIKDDKKKRDFIINNSIELKDCYEEDITVDYVDKQMMNFFKINLPELIKKSLHKINDEEYRWGRYIIKFHSPLVEKDCLNYLDSKIKELGIDIDDIEVVDNEG